MAVGRHQKQLLRPFSNEWRMKGTVLVTGASGFVGPILVGELERRGMSVMVLPSGLDVRDAEALLRYIASYSFDYVVHLAGQSFVPRSFESPRETYEINVIGTLNLLESLKNVGFIGTFLYISSSDVYGIVNEEELPISENVAIAPRSPYAVSKAATELVCQQWGIVESGARMVIARPFNHIGVGQSAQFVISGFCRQVARIKLGIQEPVIDVGDMNVSRDFTDVRDVARAYRCILESGEHGGLYNVCSQNEVILSEVLPLLCEISGQQFKINQVTGLLRPVEQRRVLGNYEKLNRRVGWKPEIPFHQTISDVYKYWLSQVKVEG